MKILVAAVIIAFASPSAAHAVEVPHGAASDPRVKFVDYEEAQVYRIVGTFRTATQIVLSEDETIQHVALGDTVSWEVAVAGHILFLKPRERAIVVHGAPYVSEDAARGQGRLGRSWGCPALRPAVARALIDRVKRGGLIFAYYPDPEWLSSSKYLGGCEAAQ